MSNRPINPKDAADRIRRMNAGKELSQDIYGIDVDPFTNDREKRISHTKAANEIKRLEILDQLAVIEDYLIICRLIERSTI